MQATEAATVRLTFIAAACFILLSAYVEARAQTIVFDARDQQLAVDAESILPADLLAALSRETGIEIAAPPLDNIPVSIGFSRRRLADGLRIVARRLGFNHVIYYTDSASGQGTPQRLVLVANAQRAVPFGFTPPSIEPTPQKSNTSDAVNLDNSPPRKIATAESSARQEERRSLREKKGFERLLAQAERFKERPELYLQRMEQAKRKYPDHFRQLNFLADQGGTGQPSTPKKNGAGL